MNIGGGEVHEIEKRILYIINSYTYGDTDWL